MSHTYEITLDYEIVDYETKTWLVKSEKSIGDVCTALHFSLFSAVQINLRILLANSYFTNKHYNFICKSLV